MFLGCPKEAGMILIALPRSRTLGGVLCSITTSGDLGSDDLISGLPISPSPSQRLQEFPSHEGRGCKFSIS